MGLEGTWGAGGCSQGAWGHESSNSESSILPSQLRTGQLQLLSRAASRFLEQEMLSPTPRPPSLSLSQYFP